MKIININDSQFDTIVLKSSLPVLVECASPECIICKTMAERIMEAGGDYISRFIFLRLNINENKRWRDFNVKVIPTLLYFKGGLLVAKQDGFPETREIKDQIKSLLTKEVSRINLGEELRVAIDLEHIAAKFFKYIASNIKNGGVREKFKGIHQASAVHQERLGAKFRELTGEIHAPGTSNRLGGFDTRPQSFSVDGALKMAIKIEEKLLSFYKKLKKNKTFGSKDLLKALIKEESAHLKIIEKERKFALDKELFTPMETAAYPTWLNKVFK